jgi:transglutaminase-like putative cysteine protease
MTIFSRLTPSFAFFRRLSGTSRFTKYGTPGETRSKFPGRSTQSRVRRGLAFCLFLTALASAAPTPAFPAQREYKIGPAPKWVKGITPEAVPKVPVEQVSQGVYYLLSDVQVRVESRTKVTYRHIAAKAVNENGVEEIAHVSIRFDPAYQTLTLHTLNVRRGARVVPKLRTSTIRVLQREQELEYRIYDGSKTVNVVLDDVRVGDVVEYAYSLRGSNPVFGNRQSGWFDLQWAVPVSRMHGRLLWPAGRKLYLTSRNTEVKPAVRTLHGWREYRWDIKDPAPLVVEDDAPGWYDPYASVQWTEFRDWASVARWALPLYRVPARLGALQNEINGIAKASPDPRERLLAALHFVQREIRYLGVEIGSGSYAPSKPQIVLERRFGDCKDKSLLTVAMLRALGITAYPALVNTGLRKGIADVQPTPSAFNHVIVQVRMGNRDYWLDPTRPVQQGDLEHLYQPDYGYALVVEAGADRLTPMANAAPSFSRTIHAVFDGRGGMDKPVLYTVTSRIEGASAEAVRSSLASENREELQKRYLNFYAQYYPGITTKAPFTVSEEESANRLTITEQYVIPSFWKRNEKKKRREAEIFAPDVEDYLRLPRATVRTSPLGITHPVDLKYTTEVLLPEAWEIKPARTAVHDPAFEFERTIAGKDKRVVLTDHYRSRADHIAAKDAARYASNLNRARDAVGYVLYRSDNVLPSAMGVLERVNWSVTVAAVLLLLLWSWLAARLYRFDPQPVAQVDENLQGIRGWLILPAIGVVVAPLRLFVDFAQSVPTYAADNWAFLTTAGSTAYHAMWAPVLLYELGANLAQIVFSLLLAVLFFKKRSSAPLVYVGFLCGVVIVQITDFALAKTIPAAATAIGPQDWSSLTRIVASLVIWGAYFLSSRRVKATFVNRYEE